jgi:hypothetical protein
MRDVPRSHTLSGNFTCNPIRTIEWQLPNDILMPGTVREIRGHKKTPRRNEGSKLKINEKQKIKPTDSLNYY